MKTILVAGAVSLLVALLGTPIAIKVFSRRGYGPVSYTHLTLPTKYPVTDAMTMTVPPMVGVPRLVTWAAGPSSLISCP